MPFEKGVAANPGGGTKEQARARKLAQRKAAEYVEEAVMVHVAVMRDATAAPAARVTAAATIIDRAAGKATNHEESERTERFVFEVPAVIEDRAEWTRQATLPSRTTTPTTIQ